MGMSGNGEAPKAKGGIGMVKSGGRPVLSSLKLLKGYQITLIVKHCSNSLPKNPKRGNCLKTLELAIIALCWCDHWTDRDVS